MGTLKLVNPHDLTTPELLRFCQGLGLIFATVDGEKLRITGRLEVVNADIQEAVKAARDELVALVWCIEHGIDYVKYVSIEQHNELNRLINALCDAAPHTTEHRQAMLQSSAAMRPVDIPHCIEHFKRCMWHIERGSYWAFKAKFD